MIADRRRQVGVDPVGHRLGSGDDIGGVNSSSSRTSPARATAVFAFSGAAIEAGRRPGRCGSALGWRRHRGRGAPRAAVRSERSGRRAPPVSSFAHRFHHASTPRAPRKRVRFPPRLWARGPVEARLSQAHAEGRSAKRGPAGTGPAAAVGRVFRTLSADRCVSEEIPWLCAILPLARSDRCVTLPSF